ncbi:MAG: Hsp20/alpha crystallin family protein [Atribacterota bacterium]
MKERSNIWVFEQEIQKFMEHVLKAKSSIILISDDAWVPPCDVFETEGSFVVVMELAGVDLDDVEILIRGQKLIVQGIRKEVPFPLKKDYYRMEINFGPFYREVDFQENVDPDTTRAYYRRGFLIVECKKRTAETKKIPVR